MVGSTIHLILAPASAVSFPGLFGSELEFRGPNISFERTAEGRGRSAHTLGGIAVSPSDRTTRRRASSRSYLEGIFSLPISY